MDRPYPSVQSSVSAGKGVRTDGEPKLIDACWGLLASWVMEPGKLAQPINAKIETAGEKPMFGNTFKRPHMLVPA